MGNIRLNLFDLRSPKIRTLHFTWPAFFLTFLIWFNHAPMVLAISKSLSLTELQWKSVLILNVALTIPSRIIIGMLVDRYGPRVVFSLLLMISGVLCVFFSMARNYEQLALARFLLGFVGAGFVIGIRLVGEWFPAREVGLAEGIYGGWCNFGSAAAAMTLPALALFYGGPEGWRPALLSSGVFAFIYGIFFYKVIRDTPEGSTYFKPKKTGGMEVSTPKDFYFLILMTLPMYLALGVLCWRLSPAGVGLLNETTTKSMISFLLVLLLYQISQIYRVNRDMLKNPESIPEMYRYQFRQVAILNINYFVTFGSELAVVSMLPFFFNQTFGLGPIKSGLLASGFALMNLVARPCGGYISDRFGRRITMLIFIIGLACGYLIMSRINGNWALALAVMATMSCSLFVQAGEGAVFAMVPLIQRRLTGQIAGMTGAYGNVGAVFFLTVYSFVNASTFFLIIACSALAAFFASWFLVDPEGQQVEIMPDGTVTLIEVT